MPQRGIELLGDPSLSKRIVHIERIKERKGKYAGFPSWLGEEIIGKLERWGIKRLFSHQKEAIEAIRRGENVVIATGTASGKSLCYLIPTLFHLSQDKENTFLYLFPTKALAQDQLKKIWELEMPCIVSTYDGDTPVSHRAYIRQNANLILSNPDMLHLSILPRHYDWARFFSHLKLVVVDEVHYYRGVLGSHMANILRRLRRILSYYGSNPVFIFCSATISNPADHCKVLSGLEVRAITEDTSPSPPKDFILWNPPLIAQGVRRSANMEAVESVIATVKGENRAIVFTKARRTAELIARYIKQNSDLRIACYRAGYTAKERRKIEEKLFKGELQVVVATSALELGIDIGKLDVCILVGYPGSIASTLQMAGRVGRQREGLVILIAREDVLDQFILRHPGYLFRSSPEEAIVDPENPYILKDHLGCACFELPLDEPSLTLFGERSPSLLQQLAQEGKVKERRGKWFWSGGGYPPNEVDIRSIKSDEYHILDISKGGKIIGTEEGIRAFKTLHQGAIYLYQGESYLVYELDIKNKKAYVAPTQADYYTEAISLIDVKLLNILAVREIGKATGGFAEVEISEQVVSYRIKKLYTEEVLSIVPLDLPPVKFTTQAFFFLLPPSVEEGVRKRHDLAGSLHAVEHASIGILPLLAMCDRMDIGGVSTSFHPGTAHPTVFIYDAYEGGVGIAKRAFERGEEVLNITLRAIEECQCKEGCPACVLSPKCGNNNKPMDKRGAVHLLKEVLA